MTSPTPKRVCCAIYTRVSDDQGLEQDFNSLDAQYDASQSYIRSQAHAGWTLIRSKYDDGGADLTKGTGHYNLAQGASGSCWGLGAALSNGVAGFIVSAFGFSAAFLFLSACAVAAALLFWLGVPETRDMATRDMATTNATSETAQPLPGTAVAR